MSGQRSTPAPPVTFQRGDKVRIVTGGTLTNTPPDGPIGCTGRVIRTDSLYITVQIDTPVCGLTLWHCLPTELEAVTK